MDDEKLIFLVQEKNEIWNKYNPLYKSIDRKKEAWIEIAHEMESTEEETIRRWTSLRDRFTREIKKREQSSESDTNIHVWPYFEMMEFLRPHIASRPLRGRGQSIRMSSLFKKRSPPPSPTQPLSTESRSVSPTASPVNCEEFTQIFDDPLIEPPLLRKKLKKSNSDVDKSFCEAVETLKKACELNEARHANPAVHAFGEMIVSTICSMNSRNQIKAMQQVTDMVMRIKLEEDELLEHVTYSTL
ncbi:hypothetical protein FF38_14397 [Lucilia cuprina]|uniref:MADF domain-containing protein n=1 Tax=Lucilia cuprina TaxID=7375 RepID=A0A0L0CI64_LUCCU|nr:Transcription factor Adf-1 [Lucilia cuprina]KNC31189.1 hypothetical protein FF38_14397 [Lucilia cuprina]